MRGADELVAKLERLKNIKSEVVALVHETVNDVVIAAFRDLPDELKIKGSTTNKTKDITGIQITSVASNGGLSEKITVTGGGPRSELAAYAEFGTGASAAEIVPTLPSELQAVARTYFKNGRGRLIGSPYLWPNWVRYTANFESELQLILDRVTQ